MGSLCKAVVLFSFLCLAASNSFADANWPNEPAGSKVLLDCGFDTPTCDGRLDDVYNATGTKASPPSAGTARVVSDDSAPYSKSSVFRSSLFYPNKSGGIQLGFYTGQNVKEMYVGLWWKTNPEFSGNLVEMNKMFFIRGPASNGFFGLLRSGTSFRFGYSHNSGNLDNSHTCSNDLGLTCYPNVSSGAIVPGQWYRLEAYTKASTTRTSRDGVLRWWVNGQLVGNYTNFNYGDSLNDWTWAETWDGYGNGTGFKADAHHFIDHLHVSVPNGGNIPIQMPQPQPQPQPAPAPAPMPAPVPAPMPSVGTVSDLAVVSSTSSSVNLSFTEVSDGSGAPAKYDLRVGVPGSQWGSMNSISAGNCTTPIVGSQVGSKKTCTISGLLPSTQYQFQMVAFSGVMNQGASYGGLSSAVSATTQAGSPAPSPQPAPAPAPAPGPIGIPVPAPAPAPAPNPGSGDGVAPQASFVYPVSGATLTGSVLLLAQAADNVGVTELRFYINGVQLGPELKQSPYAMVTDTTKIQDGNHELSVIAKDAAGNVSLPSKIRINVLNSGVAAGSNPMIDVAGCMQTKTNQINASMSLIWLLPLAGLMRRRKKE